MATQPRKGLKPAAPAKDAAQALKQAASERLDGASLDTFNSLPAATPAGAAADAVRVRAISAEAAKGLAGLEPPAQGDRHQPAAAGERFTPAPTASLGIAQPEGAAAEAKQVEEAAAARLEPALGQFPRGGESGSESGSSAAASSVSSAASAAEAVREAARARLEPAVSRDFTEQQPGVTEEAPTAYADRMGVNLGEMLERLNPGVVGREAGIGEGQDAPTAFRDSGRDALEAQVDEAFDLEGDTAAQGRTPGRMGTPADLGVTGGFGTKAGLDSGSSGAGMDLFDVSLPNRGVSGAANDLGLMQGIVGGMGANPDVGYSVAIGAADEGAPKPPGTKEPPYRIKHIEPTEVDGEPVAVPDAAPIEPTIVVEDALRALAQGLEAVAPYLAAGAIAAAAGAAAVGSGGTLAPAAAAAAAALLAVTPPEGSGTGEGKAPDATNPGREGSGIIGTPTAAEMAWRAAARERLHIGQGGPGDIDPADNHDAVPDGPAPGLAQVGMADKALTEFLVGQPGEGAVRGSGSIGFGNLPGDMGNIDYGPDSTGAWSSNTRTENEADALGSFGGSGLSIADAHRSGDDEDDQDGSDDNN